MHVRPNAQAVGRRIPRPQDTARLQALDPDGRHGVVARVLATFESSLLRQMAQLDEARERGDADEIGRVIRAALGGTLAEIEQDKTMVARMAAATVGAGASE